MSTLVQKAKSIRKEKKPSRYNNEEIELALAWVNNEVSLTEITKVLDKNLSSAYIFLAKVLKEYLINNK